MRAIVVREFGSPDVMKLENAPEPVPGPGQVTIRVHAAGVNPVDTYIRAGAYARKPNLPYSADTVRSRCARTGRCIGCLNNPRLHRDRRSAFRMRPRGVVC